MMFVIEKVLAGDVNQRVVSSLRGNGIPAVGLSGGQDQILICVPSANAELMRVGTVEHVNTHAMEVVLKYSKGVIPVVAPIGVGNYGDKFNVNADWAATQIAIALKAEKLVFLTDQFGILNADQELVKVAPPRLLERMMLEGVISGGMSTKVRAMVRAIQKGIKQVQVLHATTASLLLTDETIGTLIQPVRIAHSRTETTSTSTSVRRKKRAVVHERAG
jgi:acetylglutamate kinase